MAASRRNPHIGPAASSWGANILEVFVRGTDGGMWQKTWDGSAWSQWQPLSGVLTSDPSAVSSTAGLGVGSLSCAQPWGRY